MASCDIGKPEAVAWVHKEFNKGETCLDVGACDGKWFKLLGDYLTLDAVEIYAPNIVKHNLKDKYQHVYQADIRTFNWAGHYYDLIIFGDVLEHMSVAEAQIVLGEAWTRCRDLIVAVPYRWVNRSHYGNPWEFHIQDDLTPENVLERYPGLMPVFITERYGYYTKRGRSWKLEDEK